MAALAPPPANPISAMIRATPNLRGFESSQVFQFCYETAKIKSRANAAFLCFRWKTSHFVKHCGGWDTVDLREPYFALWRTFLFNLDTCCMPKGREPI
jgi:hypothetical protein